MKPPRVGAPAPPFSLETDTGDVLSLADLRGKTVVLFFYPKDSSTGCTQEACEFGELMPRFKRSKAIVLGISPDSARKHRNFKKKFALPYPLLVDADATLAKRYGIWVEKMLYGHKYMAVERTTVIIGPDGVIRRIFPKVTIEGHAAEVFAAVKALGV